MSARDMLADELREWVHERDHAETPRTPGEMADRILRLTNARWAAPMRLLADDLYEITGARYIADALTSVVDRLVEDGRP